MQPKKTCAAVWTIYGFGREHLTLGAIYRRLPHVEDWVEVYA